MLQDIAGAAPAADGLVKDVTTQSFMKDVIEESKRQPVLVDFFGTLLRRARTTISRVPVPRKSPTC